VRSAARVGSHGDHLGELDRERTNS